MLVASSGIASSGEKVLVARPKKGEGYDGPGFRTAAEERYLKKHVEQEHANGKKDFGQRLEEEFGGVKR